MSTKSLKILNEEGLQNPIDWNSFFIHINNMVSSIKSKNIREKCLEIVKHHETRFREVFLPFYQLLIKNGKKASFGSDFDYQLMRQYEFIIVSQRINEQISEIVEILNNTKDKNIKIRLVKSLFNQMRDLNHVSDVILKNRDEDILKKSYLQPFRS